MPDFLELAGAVAVEVGLSCSYSLAIRRGARVRLLALLVLGPIVLLVPHGIPPDRRFARLLAAVLAIAEAVKLFDLHLGAGRGDRPGFGPMFGFLINLASLVHRKLHLEPVPGWRADLRRLAGMVVATIPGVLLFSGSYRVDWRPWPFALEHCVKALAFFLVVVPGGSAGAAAWRLLGQRAREPMARPFSAATPAEFWTRYNRPAQQFFFEDVFKPLGGRRRPILGTLATFLVSGLIHEYLFVVAIGRVQGYQVAFFLIQGVAVALTIRARPEGGWRAVGIAATLAFNLATGTLFFASIDEVAPFYQRR